MENFRRRVLANFESWAAQVKVANSARLKLIAQAKIKTDARDALNLARLLAVGLIPEVWVPPQEVRELPILVAQRQGLVQQRTCLLNQLHALLMSHNLTPPVGQPFGELNRGWWEQLPLSNPEKLLLKQHFQLLDNLQPLISEVERELTQLSTTGRWADQTALVLQLPGIGILSAMTILSAIGDITRFESAKHLVGYSGLGSSVYATGQTVRTGSITKQGRPELHTALVEAAWVAVEQEGSYWHSQFERLASRVGKSKAIVAIARKMLVVIWDLLSKQVADQRADETKVAQKLVKWGYELRRQGRHGLSSAQFVRQELKRLGLGHKELIVKRGAYELTIPPAYQEETTDKLSLSG